MRLAFMGSPDFAVPALRALHAAGHEIACVYSQPPRPAGRGQALRLQPVHAAAEALGIPVRTPVRLKRDPAEQQRFAALELDAAVVAAYGLILPPAMLEAPRFGCLNIHASLLPRWRGAAPIQAAILHGDAETGITIMRMAEGLDTGDMLLREALPIGPADTAAGLHDALAAMGAALAVRALAVLPLDGEPQDDALSCYAPRLERLDGRLDWADDARALDRRVRAMTPWPGAFAHFGEVAFKVAGATPLAERHHDAVPGTVLEGEGEGDLIIACGRGALRLTALQWPGRAMLDAASFLRGRPIPPGTRLG